MKARVPARASNGKRWPNYGHRLPSRGAALLCDRCDLAAYGPSEAAPLLAVLFFALVASLYTSFPVLPCRKLAGYGVDPI